MSAFLLKWNPKIWPWNDLAQRAAQTAKGKVLHYSWTCGRTKRITNGDRLFLLRLGKEPKGLMASGWATSRPYLDWFNPTRRRKALYIDCIFERILDHEVEGLLPLSRLTNGKLKSVAWTNQGSGIEICPDVIGELVQLWERHIGSTSMTPPLPEAPALEGEARLCVARHYKRESWKREEKIREALKKGMGRLVCEVSNCGFDFLAVYGELGRGYAQVHHLKPLKDRTSPSKTSLKDLVVVCANCHAMIHRGGECRKLHALIP